MSKSIASRIENLERVFPRDPVTHQADPERTGKQFRQALREVTDRYDLPALPKDFDALGDDFGPIFDWLKTHRPDALRILTDLLFLGRANEKGSARTIKNEAENLHNTLSRLGGDPPRDDPGD
ncbi:MAG: hypothetical protein ACLFUS_12440 [Candidatus Sumerlaeia bacterium]